MTPFAGVLAALAAVTPQSPVADPRTALEQRLGTAEVAYAECLREVAIGTAIALVEPVDALDKVRAACAAEWDAYAELRRAERRYVLESAPDAGGPSPAQFASNFRTAFERDLGRSYSEMLKQARAWTACMEELGDREQCLQRARSTYDGCLQAAFRLPSFRLAESLADARSAALRKCEPEHDGLAVVARLGGASKRDRIEFRQRVRAELFHAWRAPRPKRIEACAAAEAGCGGGSD